MTWPVSCTQCGAKLDEPSDMPPEQRLPCPACGSMGRSFHVTASGAVGVSATAIASVDYPLLLQAVVTFGGKTTEGNIIESIAPAWIEIARLLKHDPSFIHKIDARKWEEIIAGVYKKAGFDDVILTPRSGDYGRDIIAVKHGILSVRFIDQVKAYRPGHLVTADDVRALLGVLLSDQNATKGIVTTTSRFAPRICDDPLIKPHMPYRLELIDGNQLVSRLDELARV